MNSINNITRSGSCSGTIGEGITFNAHLVELKSQTFPPPHGESHVMFARQRAPGPEFTTKEVKVSARKDLANGTYTVSPDSTEVRVTFVDNTVSTEPVFYLPLSGTIDIKFDNITGVFSGKLKDVLLENQDDDEDKTLTLNLEFDAKSDISSARKNKSVRQAA
ncbi:hypothetical protein [Pseudomonas sp. UMAB-40]|jgi:hypothetical protein|uniref:hypothetical protein n=1 Tax=Pseudomonas sp. UMAB-40 TaxID=1365407 RepID=UPI001C56B57C|nr:hypothetical protein [Pseudomonas sp. UMAB-40]